MSISKAASSNVASPKSIEERLQIQRLVPETEVVTYNAGTDVIRGLTQTSKTIFDGKYTYTSNDFRGGSQVIQHNDKYLAIIHDVDLFNSEVGRKDAIYRHRFVYWDKNFNMVKFSEPFSIMGGDVEFSIGIAKHYNQFLITFGFQDNAAYLLRFPQEVIDFYVR